MSPIQHIWSISKLASTMMKDCQWHALHPSVYIIYLLCVCGMHHWFDIWDSEHNELHYSIKYVHKQKTSIPLGETHETSCDIVCLTLEKDDLITSLCNLRSSNGFLYVSEEKDANKSVISSRLMVSWSFNRAANPLITLINYVCVVTPGCHTSLCPV